MDFEKLSNTQTLDDEMRTLEVDDLQHQVRIKENQLKEANKIIDELRNNLKRPKIISATRIKPEHKSKENSRDRIQLKPALNTLNSPTHTKDLQNENMVINENYDSIFNTQKPGESTSKTQNSNDLDAFRDSMVSFNKEYRNNRFTIKENVSKTDPNHVSTAVYYKQSSCELHQRFDCTRSRRSREDRMREMSRSTSNGSLVSLDRHKLRQEEIKMFSSKRANCRYDNYTSPNSNEKENKSGRWNEAKDVSQESNKVYFRFLSFRIGLKRN